MHVTLSFTVNPEGRVLNPKVVEGSDPSWNESALAAVRFWQFIPRIRDGKPVTSQVQQRLQFGAPK